MCRLPKNNHYKYNFSDEPTSKAFFKHISCVAKNKPQVPSYTMTSPVRATGYEDSYNPGLRDRDEQLVSLDGKVRACGYRDCGPF